MNRRNNREMKANHPQSCFVIIPAAGNSTRMRLQSTSRKPAVSKQLLTVAGKPLIAYTLSRFQASPLVTEIVVVTNEACIAAFEKIIVKYRFGKVSALVLGGKERQDSIYNGLKFLEEHRDLTSSVTLVHDGARPFIMTEQIDAIIHETMQHGACVPAVKVKDTIRHFKNEFFGKTIDRSTLMQIQTPQGFKTDLLLACYRKAIAKKFRGTDDASLVEKFFPKVKVKVFESAYENIKITTPEDVLFAQAILQSRRY
jgi:2-C-methyl-D-erythritol 4-phosphate cytidylyltransferase